MKNYHILCVIGTRPEALKMIPVIKALSKIPSFTVHTLLTGQHRELLNMALKDIVINNITHYQVMTENQTLSDLNIQLLAIFDEYLQQKTIHLVIAQGDTTTTLAAAMAAFYKKIPFAHVEAGLRTSSIHTPYPEEFNRRVATLITTLHCCPTQYAVDNLNKEGIHANVFLTGNTIIDMLYEVAEKIEVEKTEKKLILVTCHRRENFGVPLSNICKAIRALAERNAQLEFFFPVHPNPNVRAIVHEELSQVPGVYLSGPVEYEVLVKKMKSAFLILTDSGGLQEEAPALGKPVLILRNETERPEGVACGAAQLVGTETAALVGAVEALLTDRQAYQSMCYAGSPYGDGKAGTRISDIIQNYFNIKAEQSQFEALI